MGTIVNLIRQTFKEWSEDKASRLAAALAYYTVFSIPPLLVILLTILGQLFNVETLQDEILQQVGAVTGEQGRDAIATILENADQPGNQELLPALLSFALLLFGASGVFVALQDAMNTVWEVAPRPDRGLMGTLRDRFFSFTMVLVIGFLLLVSLMISAVLAALDSYLVGLFPGAETILQIFNFLLSFGLVVLLFALLFKYVPDVKIAFSDVWIGAVVTALLFTLGEIALGLYLDQSDPGSTYGAAGSLIVLLLWVYYSAQILFLGAEFTQVYANQHGSRIRPEEHAIALDEEARAKEGIPRKEQLQEAAREQ